jgi:hypothetical protein
MSSTTPTVRPFFARGAAKVELVVRTGIIAGRGESDVKSGKEDSRK